MINHARTLLLNSRETDDPAPWERYMGPFSALELPNNLEQVRRALVGTGGWWDRTYRVELLLEMLDSPKYAGTFDWMDSRVTPPLVDPVLYYQPRVSVSWVSSLIPDTYVTYLDKPNDKEFPIKRVWNIKGTNSERYTVKYLGNYFDINAYYDSAAEGWRLRLADDFDLLFSEVASEDETWNVQAYVKPQNMFALYPAIVNSLPSAWTYPMFSAVDPDDEPVKEYFRWNKECVHAEDQVAAVTLAYLLKASKQLLPV